MPSQVALSSVFRLVLKILCGAFNYLYLFEHMFLEVQVVCKDDFHIPFVCLCYTLEGIFHKTKTIKKTRGVIIVCSGLKKVSSYFTGKR